MKKTLTALAFLVAAPTMSFAQCGAPAPSCNTCAPTCTTVCTQPVTQVTTCKCCPKILGFANGGNWGMWGTY